MINYLFLIFSTYFTLTFIIQNETFSKQITPSKYYLFFLFFVLVLFSVFKPENIADYVSYKLFYNHMDKVLEHRLEPTAFLIRFISPNFYIFLLVYASISISIKLIVIDKYASLPFFSIMTYLSTSYILHDLVQIRISCSVALFLLALPYLVKGNKFKYIVLIYIASLFHKSAVVFFIFLFFNTTSYNKFFWIFLVIFSYFISFIGLDLLKLVSFILPAKSYYYMSIIDKMNENNIDLFSINQLLCLIVFLLLSMNMKKIKNKYIIIYLKVFACSICVLPFFKSLTLVASRFSEMLRPSIIFLLPELIFVTNKKSVGYIIFLIFCFMFAFLNNFYYSVL